MVLEKTLESLLDSKEIKPINPIANQPWIFTGRTDAVTEAPILWLPDVKNQLIGKDPDARKEWRQEEKGTTEVEVIGWYHQLDVSLSKIWKMVRVKEVWRAIVHGVTKSRTQLSNWTTATKNSESFPECFQLTLPKSISGITRAAITL